MNQERDDFTDKSSAEFINASKKAGFSGVDSLVVTNSFKKELPAVFGRVKPGVLSESPLPDFKTFEKFDTQVKTSSVKHALEVCVRERQSCSLLWLKRI